MKIDNSFLGKVGRVKIFGNNLNWSKFSSERS